jgi:hypothetical protein
VTRRDRGRIPKKGYRGLAEGSVCIFRGARKCFISILTSYPYTPTVILISGGTLLSHGRYMRNIRRPDSRGLGCIVAGMPVLFRSPSPEAKLSLLRMANSSPICDDLRKGESPGSQIFAEASKRRLKSAPCANYGGRSSVGLARIKVIPPARR